MNPTEIAALFVIVVLLAVIVHQAVTFHMERRAWSTEKKDLMNRLMARDFGEYAAGSRVVGAVDYRNLGDYVRKTQTAEDPEKEEQGDGLGIPVG
jgi:hypothetical protein